MTFLDLLAHRPSLKSRLLSSVSFTSEALRRCAKLWETSR